MWTSSSPLGDRARNAEREQTGSDDEHNAEDDHDSGFAGRPALFSLGQEGVDGVTGFVGREGCHFGLWRG